MPLSGVSLVFLDKTLEDILIALSAAFERPESVTGLLGTRNAGLEISCRHGFSILHKGRGTQMVKAFRAVVSGEMPSDPDASRPRGVLSGADRRYLKDPESYAQEHSRQSVRERKKAIRERTRNALLDFQILFEELPPEERKKIFTPPGARTTEFEEAIISLLGFVYGEADPLPQLSSFETLLSAGIRRATRQMAGGEDLTVEVDFGVHVESPDSVNWTDVVDKAKSGNFDSLSEVEIRAFVREYAKAENFDPEEPLRQWQKHAEEALGEDESPLLEYTDARRKKGIPPGTEPRDESDGNGHGDDRNDQDAEE